MEEQAEIRIVVSPEELKVGVIGIKS